MDVEMYFETPHGTRVDLRTCDFPQFEAEEVNVLSEKFASRLDVNTVHITISLSPVVQEMAISRVSPTYQLWHCTAPAYEASWLSMMNSALRANPHVQNMVLHMYEPPSRALGVLFRMLRLDRLEICGIDTFDKYASILEMHDVRSLQITACVMTDQGVQLLQDVLSEKPTFSRLTLQYCNMVDSAMEKLEEWMQSHPRLEKLNLILPSIPPTMLKAFAKNPHLRHLMVPITSPATMQALLDMVRVNTGISSLQIIHANQFSDMEDEMISAFESNTTLIHLYVGVAPVRVREIVESNRLRITAQRKALCTLLSAALPPDDFDLYMTWIGPSVHRAFDQMAQTDRTLSP